MPPELPAELWGPLATVLYLVLVAIVLSFIYGIVEWFSKDRVLKLVEGKNVFVFIGKEAFYGRMLVPPRSGGGFEVFFPGERIENPKSLLAFLAENYHETGEKKFLEEANRLLEDFKRRGILSEDFDIEHVRVDPWSSPSLVSRKIYSSDLGSLFAIMIFRETLPKKERKRRWSELRALYHPSLPRIFARRVYNALAYVKDKIAATVTRSTSIFLGALTPELRKGMEELQKKAVGAIGAAYDALLENSIGRLVTVRVQDVEGETKLYQGVLREYSSSYVYVYDVDYRIQVVTVFRNFVEEEGYPKTLVKFHRYSLDLSSHIKMESNNGELVLRNISKTPVKIEKLRTSKEGEELSIGRTLFPGESLSLRRPEGADRIVVEYEVSKEADIVWPRNKIKILGLGDYPPHLLGNVLKIKTVRL